jgi:hypothetical protein
MFLALQVFIFVMAIRAAWTHAAQEFMKRLLQWAARSCTRGFHPLFNQVINSF